MKRILSFLLLLLVCHTAIGQFHNKNATLYDFTGSIRFSGPLRLPKDTLVGSDTGQIGYKDGRVWFKDETGHFQGLAKLSEAGGSSNIYNTDDTLTGDRKLSGGTGFNKGLWLDSLEYFYVTSRSGDPSAPSIYLDTLGFYFNAPAYYSSFPVISFDTTDFKPAILKGDGLVARAPSWGGIIAPIARNALSLTTTGTSGVATYNSGTGVLNIPNYDDKNIAEDDLTFTGHRSHDMDGYDLEFYTIGDVHFEGDNTSGSGLRATQIGYVTLATDGSVANASSYLTLVDERARLGMDRNAGRAGFKIDTIYHGASFAETVMYSSNSNSDTAQTGTGKWIKVNHLNIRMANPGTWPDSTGIKMVIYDPTSKNIYLTPYYVGGGAGAGLVDGDYGDITVSGTGTVMTIDNGAVTNAKLANSTISGIALGSNLADLTATDATLTFSGAYNGSTARTIGLNLGNANTWSAAQSGPLNTYNATTWDGSQKYVTENDIRDKIESLGAGSGTVNTGAQYKLAWYPSAGTTVDDLSEVDFQSQILGVTTSGGAGALTGMRLTNTTGLIGIEINGGSSRSGTFFVYNSDVPSYNLVDGFTMRAATGSKLGLSVGNSGSGNGAQFVMDGSGLVINDGSEDFDFRIESNTEANMFFIDASKDEIFVGGNTDNGAYEFQVNGDTYLGGTLLKLGVDANVGISYGVGNALTVISNGGNLSLSPNAGVTYTVNTKSTGTYFTNTAFSGVTDADAVVELAAGTSTAGTAPLKLNSGTALGTPEDGAVEYHGSHLYFTIGSTRYQLDQQPGTVYTAGTGISLPGNAITLKGWQDWNIAEVTTSDATVTTAATITPPDNTSGILIVYMVGIETVAPGTTISGQKIIHWKKVSGTVTINQITATEADYLDGFATATWTVDGNSGNIRVRVTGEASTGITWAPTYTLKYLQSTP
jgi:hypothetical protein